MAADHSRDSWLALVQDREDEILRLRKVVQIARRVVKDPTPSGMVEALTFGEVQELIDALKELDLSS